MLLIASRFLRRYSRLRDPSTISWTQASQGRVFSKDSDSSDGENEGHSSSDDDDQQQQQPSSSSPSVAAAAAAAPSPPIQSDVFDAAAEFEAFTKSSAKRTKPQQPPPRSSSPSSTDHPQRSFITGDYPISAALKQLLDTAKNMSEADIIADFQEDEDIRRSNRELMKAASSTNTSASSPPSPNKKQPHVEGYRRLARAQPEDLLLLAETIEAYLALVPAPHSPPPQSSHQSRGDPRYQQQQPRQQHQQQQQRSGFSPFERAILSGMAHHIRNVHGNDNDVNQSTKPTNSDEPQILNTAPPGRLAWEVLGVNEDRGVIHWGVDLTNGKAPDPWRNARISEDVKKAMYEAHTSDPEKYSVKELAKMIKIREQRVMAILALKELEEADPYASTQEAEEVRRGIEEGVYQCVEATGSGEKYVVTVPSYPAYAEVDASKVLAKLEKVLGKRVEEMEEGEVTREVVEEVLGIKGQEGLEEELAGKEDAMMIEEFTRALDFHMGRVGAGLVRGNRGTKAPRRPTEGWSLVVTPLGRDKGKGEGEGGEEEARPYVATPSGERRELNADEAFLLERKTPRPRRRLV